MKDKSLKIIIIIIMMFVIVGLMTGLFFSEVPGVEAEDFSSILIVIVILIIIGYISDIIRRD